MFQNYKDNKRKKEMLSLLLNNVGFSDVKLLIDIVNSDKIKEIIKTEKEEKEALRLADEEKWEEAVAIYHKRMIADGIPEELWEV